MARFCGSCLFTFIRNNQRVLQSDCNVFIHFYYIIFETLCWYDSVLKIFSPVMLMVATLCSRNKSEWILHSVLRKEASECALEMFTYMRYGKCLIYLFLVGTDAYFNKFGNTNCISMYSPNIGHHIWWIQVIFPVSEQLRRLCNSLEYV